MRTPRSLSSIVTVWTASAIAISMLVYAVFQYYLMPGMTVSGLILHHLWHVVALGAVIYVVCWAGFRRILLQPLETICEHLYAVGAGKLLPLTLEPRVAEIRTIVEGINIMIARLQQTVEAQHVAEAEHHVADIRELLNKLPTNDQASVTTLLQRLDELGTDLTAIVTKEIRSVSKSDTQPLTMPRP